MTTTITLTLPYEHAAKVLTYISTLLAFDSSTTSAEKPKEEQPSPKGPFIPVEAPVVTKPSPTIKGNQPKPKMAAFGRTQDQVNTYESSEEARIDKLDEEAEVRKEKKQVKIQEEAQSAAEVEDIKAAVVEEITPPVLPSKPW